MKQPKRTRNETLKIRYQVYRRLGYDSRTSRALAQRSLDVSGLEISSKTGKLKRNTVTKTYLNTTMEEYKNRKYVDNYVQRTKSIVNDTNYTKHGLLTHDKRYRGETGRVITVIRNENKIKHVLGEDGQVIAVIRGQNRLTTNQAYYFFYFMTRYGLTYKETQEQLLTNKEFEEYEKAKREHAMLNRAQRQQWIDERNARIYGSKPHSTKKRRPKKK